MGHLIAPTQSQGAPPPSPPHATAAVEATSLLVAHATRRVQHPSRGMGGGQLSLMTLRLADAEGPAMVGLF